MKSGTAQLTLSFVTGAFVGLLPTGAGVAVSEMLTGAGVVPTGANVSGAGQPQSSFSKSPLSNSDTMPSPSASPLQRVPSKTNATSDKQKPAIYYGEEQGEVVRYIGSQVFAVNTTARRGSKHVILERT